MSTLDDDYGYIDPATVSPQSTALRYGGIAGVLLIIISLIMYLTGMVDYEATAQGASNWTANILNWAIWIGAIIMAMKFHRDKELGGYMTFGRGFYTGFLTSVVMGVIGAVWTYLFFSFVAPEVLDIMKEAAMDKMPEDQAEAAEGMMGMFMSSGFFAISMLIMTIVIGAIIASIASAVMKKEHPAAA